MRLGSRFELLPTHGLNLGEWHAHALFLEAIWTSARDAWLDLLESAFMPFHQEHGQIRDAERTFRVFIQASGAAVLSWGERRQLTWATGDALLLHLVATSQVFLWLHRVTERRVELAEEGSLPMPPPSDLWRRPEMSRVLQSGPLPPPVAPPQLMPWDPHLATWKEWSDSVSRELAEYRRAVLDHGKVHGSLPPPRKDKEHFEWLALYQVGGHSFTQIAKRARHSRQTVEEAIKSAARLIGLSLREPTKGGRPRASRPN